jgi:hypothetical protein
MYVAVGVFCVKRPDFLTPRYDVIISILLAVCMSIYGGGGEERDVVGLQICVALVSNYVWIWIRIYASPSFLLSFFPSYLSSFPSRFAGLSSLLCLRPCLYICILACVCLHLHSWSTSRYPNMYSNQSYSFHPPIDALKRAFLLFGISRPRSRPPQLVGEKIVWTRDLRVPSWWCCRSSFERRRWCCRGSPILVLG